METKQLAQKLKELRVLRWMSQEYLAEESRVSLRTIQRIENNESDPTGETIKRIANALDIQLTELTSSNLVNSTKDLKGTIIYLKKQLSKTNNKSEIKTFEKFIDVLEKIKAKELTPNQIESIESYIKYLELEKIPSFSNELYKQKLTKFKMYLKNKLHFVPNNYYTTWATSLGGSFAIGFSIQSGVESLIKITVFSVAFLLIIIGLYLDSKIKKQNRSFSF